MDTEWKTYIEILNALLTPAIASVTIYIAVQQYRIEKRKFQYDVMLQQYDRRLRVYEGTKDFIWSVMQHENSPDWAKFHESTKEAPFLFGKDKAVIDYLDELKKRAGKLQACRSLYKDDMQKPPENYDHSKVVDGMHVELLWFTEQLDAAPNLFQKYLNIG